MARREKENKKYGYGKDPSEVTEEEQQKCVSASATVGALIPYIRRYDESHAKSIERYFSGQIGPPTKQQQEACVSASATAGAFLRYICRRDEHYANKQQQFGWNVEPEKLTDKQQQACVSASSTVDACS